jgi:glycosyltransferase involved in cell wall biosynthesis
MKILFVNNFRGRGGGEEFLRELLPGLAAQGHEIGLICRPETPLVEIFSNSRVLVYPIRRSGLSAISAVFKTAAVIRKGEYAIIDIQRGHDIIQSWLGSLISGRKPVLMYTPQVPEFVRSRFLLSRMKKIVTISRYIRDRIIDFSPEIASRISIIYYGIDLSTFTSTNIKRGRLRQRLNLPDDAPIIGTVGDLWKNQIEFLDALVLIRKTIPGALFAVAGSQTGIGQVQEFKDRASRLGLGDAIVWTGRLAKDEMLSFYSDIDIAVCTHRNEGFGIWVLEALGMGTPVVAFDAGGVKDSLEGCPAGRLVVGVDEMAQEIVRILKSPSVRNQLAGAAGTWVRERFSRERMVNDYSDFFRSLTRMTS